jgi:hypothetical protein
MVAGAAEAQHRSLIPRAGELNEQKSKEGKVAEWRESCRPGWHIDECGDFGPEEGSQDRQCFATSGGKLALRLADGRGKTLARGRPLR